MKQHHRILSLLFISWMLVQEGRAQLSFSGLGRTVFQGTEISGKALQNDSLSGRIQQQGYALFDLRTEYRLGNFLLFRLDSRMKNQLGGFGGVGMKASIRQVQVLGRIRKNVVYKLGDLDISLDQLLQNELEPEAFSSQKGAFSFRRNVRQYENLNAGENWRMRAVQLQGSAPVKELGWAEVNWKAFAATDRNLPLFRTQAPLHFGGNIQLFTKEPGWKVSGSVLRHQMSPDAETHAQIQNAALSGAFSGFRKLNLNIWSAVGTSASRWESNIPLLRPKRQDYFWRAGAVLNLDSSGSYGFQLHAHYQETGPFYENPGSQSQRISGNLQPSTLGMVNQNQTLRSQTLLDRMGEEGLQNQNLSAYRQSWLPGYDPVFPFGTYSPNRRLFFLGSRFKNHSQTLRLHGTGMVGSEVLGEGTNAKRGFRQVRFSGDVTDRQHNFSLEIQSTQIQRSGNFPTHGNYLLASAGYNLDLNRYFQIQLGVKRFSATGNEILATFNSRNEVDQYQTQNLHRKEWLWATGLQVFLSNQAFLYLSVYGNSLNGSEPLQSFSLNQWYAQFCYEF